MASRLTAVVLGATSYGCFSAAAITELTLPPVGGSELYKLDIVIDSCMYPPHQTKNQERREQVHAEGRCAHVFVGAPEQGPAVTDI